MAKESKTIETAFAEINDIVNRLEAGDATLDESFSLYTEGIKLLKYCNDKIDKVEKKIVILNGQGEEDEL